MNNKSIIFDNFHFHNIEESGNIFSLVFIDNNGNKIKRQLATQKQIDKNCEELENINYYRSNVTSESISGAIRTAMNLLRRNRDRN